MSDQRSPLVSDPGPTSGTPQVIPDDDWSRFHTIGDIAAHLLEAAVLRR